MATVGGGGVLVSRIGRLSTRVAPLSTIGGSADQVVSHPGGRAVFTVSAGHSQVGLKEEGRRQAW